MPANAADRSMDWSGLHFRPRITCKPETRWHPAATLLVLLLHIALLSWLMHDRVKSPKALESRIEIRFMERLATPALPTAEADAQPTPRPASLAPVRDAKRNPVLQAIEVSPQELEPLRLNLAPDAWQQPAAPVEQDPLRRRTRAQLPGRAEPFVEGVRFTDSTPEKVLRSIAIRYFGGVDPDPCPGARARLANLGSNPDRSDIDADLRKVERYCRP